MTFNQFARLAGIGCGVLAIVLLLTLIGIGIWAVSLNNSAVALEQRIIAQQDVLETRYDTMKKIIFQKAEISEKYAQDFKAIYPEIISGRYKDNGNLLFKFVKEANPKYDIRLLESLMTTVEGQRMKFEQEQKVLIDLVREHRTMCSNERWPSRHVVGGRSTPEVSIITSTDAKNAVATGIDNDKGVFPVKK